MDQDTRAALSPLLMEFLLIQAGSPQNLRELERSIGIVRSLTDDFIGHMRALGVDDPELEAELRRTSQDLSEAMELSREIFMLKPPRWLKGR